MPYLMEICVAGKILEVRKYHTVRFNVKGEKRQARQKVTSERQKAINAREAERTLARKIAANFDDDTGMLVTFTYLPAKRPKDSKEMGEDIKKCLRQLRKLFKDEDKILKYIYVKELGSKGAAHIHMVMSVCDVRWIRSCWQKGGVRVDPLWSDGDYSGIARYFVKYAEKTEKTEGRLIGRRWNSSRNLKEPVIIKKIVKASTFNRRIPEREGYLLEPDSVRDGYTMDGFRYFSYRMRKVAPVQRKGDG